LIFFRTHTRHFRVGVLSLFVGEIWAVCDYLVFHKACQGVIFWGTFWWSRCRCSTRALRLVRCLWRWWYSIWCVYQIFCDIWHEI